MGQRINHKMCNRLTEGNANMRELLGGKGANLAEMTNIGLPVPQGFTITTEACTQYYEDGQKINDEIVAEIMEYIDKNVREERLTAARLDFAEKFGEKYEDFETHIEVCLYKMQKKVVKKWLLQGKRVDGRSMDEIRPLAAEVGVLPRVHGSGLFTRGQTQVLSVCTLNPLSAAQKLDTIYQEDTKRYIHHVPRSPTPCVRRPISFRPHPPPAR